MSRLDHSRLPARYQPDWGSLDVDSDPPDAARVLSTVTPLSGIGARPPPPP